MSASSDRRIALALGVLGALLVALEGILELLRAVVYALRNGLNTGPKFADPFGHGVLLLVLALLAGFFAVLGRSSQERSLVPGVVLIVLALIDWVLFGLASGLLAAAGTILILVSGVVYLVAGR